MTDTSNTTPPASPTPSDWEAKAAAHARHEADLFLENKLVLLNALARAGVTHVIVTFDGYGDEGQIQNVEIRAGDDDIAMPGAMIEIDEAVWGQVEPIRSTLSIAAAIESLSYDVLERTHCGWENGDGAYGDVTFDVAEQSISLDYNDRYTAAENYTHIF